MMTSKATTGVQLDLQCKSANNPSDLLVFFCHYSPYLRWYVSRSILKYKFSKIVLLS
jgi:hypothetical protein